MPAWLLRGLGPAGRDFARQMFAEYGPLTRPHMEIVKLAAAALDRGAAARERLAAEGVILTTSTGRSIVHPLAKVERAAAAQFAMLVGRLRLDAPPARPATAAEDEEHRRLAELLAR